ncbi:MAG: hypothetical protein JNN26_05110 [Candidatus Obscuribacter sp.]|nr:hypothetical protein [Candidatus Obscuribacter sp.]
MPSEPKLVLLEGGPLSGQYCRVWGDHWVHPPEGKYKDAVERPRYEDIGNTLVSGLVELPVYLYAGDHPTFTRGFEMPFSELPSEYSDSFEIELKLPDT